MTRLDIIRSILLEWRQSQDTFGLRQLSNEVELRTQKMVLEDTCRKLADLLKPEIPFIRAGKGIRRFISEPTQGQMFNGGQNV